MMARIVKAFEIFSMIIAAIGFLANNITILFVSLFFMGAHSAFFGLVKYAILPELLDKNELIAGNALIQGSTFLAILLGTIAGGLIIGVQAGSYYIAICAILIAMVGLLSSCFIPKTIPANPELDVSLRIVKNTVSVIRFAKEAQAVFRAIIDISWFWLIGVVFLTQIPPFAKTKLHTDSKLVTLFLATFSVGIGLGSIICQKTLGSRVTAKYVPWAAIGMSVAIFDLFFASHIRLPEQYLISIDMLLTSVFGGVYIVSLYAIIQTRSVLKNRSLVVAANNVLNSSFMVIASHATSLLFVLNFSVS